MVSNKIKTIVVNPGSLYELLLNNEKFTNKYAVTKIFLNNNSSSDYDIELGNYDLIILDDISIKNNVNNYISSLNNYFSESKCVNIFDFYERHFEKIPIIKISNNWQTNEKILDLKFPNYIEYTKRISDTLFIFIFLPIIIFLLLIGIILIKLTTNGPVFFKQCRTGKNGKSFYLYKLRTMYYSEEDINKYTVFNDERVFPMGKLLRLTKIDELPQFLNILLGEMSIIGPRPEKIEIVSKLILENPFYDLRHQVRPGLTGWAQVNNPIANPTQSFEKLEYDLFYIKNANLLLELKIIFKTIIVILKRNSL